MFALSNDGVMHSSRLNSEVNVKNGMLINGGLLKASGETRTAGAVKSASGCCVTVARGLVGSGRAE